MQAPSYFAGYLPPLVEFGPDVQATVKTWGLSAPSGRCVSIYETRNPFTAFSASIRGILGEPALSLRSVGGPWLPDMAALLHEVCEAFACGAVHLRANSTHQGPTAMFAASYSGCRPVRLSLTESGSALLEVDGTEYRQAEASQPTLWCEFEEPRLGASVAKAVSRGLLHMLLPDRTVVA